MVNEFGWQVTYVSEKLLDNIGLARDSSSLDGVLVELVLLRQGYRLFPFVIFLQTLHVGM